MADEGPSSMTPPLDLDWVHVPAVDSHQTDGTSPDLPSTAAAFLDYLSSGLYEDSNYARVIWIAGTICLVMEPFLLEHTVSRSDGIVTPVQRMITLQIVVFAISTCLFIVQTIGLLFDKKPWVVTTKQVIKLPWLVGWSKGQSLGNALRGLICYFVLICKYKSILWEFVFVVIGWASFIAYRYWNHGLGIAALRTFRIFRILWYYEIKAMRPFLLARDTEVFKIHIEKDSIIIREMRKTVSALKILGQEMFSFTGRGGVLLIFIFNFTAYAFGIMFKYDAEDVANSGAIGATECKTVGKCWYTMCRLSFNDQTGFNFAISLWKKHKIMFVGTIAYVMVTTLGILYGILTIFREPFTIASQSSTEEKNAKLLLQNSLERMHHILSNRGETILALSLKIFELKRKRESRKKIV